MTATRSAPSPAPPAPTAMEPRRERLIEEHLPLVDHVVRKLTFGFPAFVDRQELVAAGRLGLTEAAQRYDFDRGLPFAAFAVRRVRGAVLDASRSTDWVPRSVRRTVRAADDATQVLQHRLGRQPVEHEVAARVGVGAEELRRARGAASAGMVTSLEQALALEVEPSAIGGRGGVVPPEEVVERTELRELVRSALHVLPERLRLVVVGHYLEGRTLEELAVTLGVTPSRVSQLRAEAVSLVRAGVEAQFEHDAGTGDELGATPRRDQRKAQFAALVAQHAEHRARELATRRYRDAQVRPSAPVAELGGG